MPTKRLYYSDSYLTSFEAQVVSSREVDGKHHVVLDRTAFYPTGGGQPHDKGWLDGVKVLDVVEREQDDEIVHLTERGLEQKRVVGRIDWERRQDHMQQHSGQHILSAAFVKVCNAPTMGFHLGEMISTIDLETSVSIPDRLNEVVQLANQIIFEDRLVRILNVQKEEAAVMVLRKDSDREGILRLIEVTNFDRTPCGGTHVGHTGHIGLLLTRKVERYKQGWRVEFVCGGRALREAGQDFQILTRVSQLLSSPFEEIPGLVEKQIDDARSSRNERVKLLHQLAAFESREMLKGAKSVGKIRFLSKQFENVDWEYVRMVAQHALSEPGVVLFLATSAEKPQVLVAASAESGVQANEVFRKASQSFRLRGGGSKNLAQGSLEDAASIPGLIGFIEGFCSTIDTAGRG